MNVEDSVYTGQVPVPKCFTYGKEHDTLSSIPVQVKFNSRTPVFENLFEML